MAKVKDIVAEFQKMWEYYDRIIKEGIEYPAFDGMCIWISADCTRNFAKPVHDTLLYLMPKYLKEKDKDERVYWYPRNLEGSRKRRRFIKTVITKLSKLKQDENIYQALSNMPNIRRNRL